MGRSQEVSVGMRMKGGLRSASTIMSTHALDEVIPANVVETGATSLIVKNSNVRQCPLWACHLETVANPPLTSIICDILGPAALSGSRETLTSDPV